MSYPLVDEVYDLLILVDSTYSMLNYVESLQTSLPKVIAISNLTNGFSRIGLLAYRDYSEAEREKDGMLEWSGWCGNDGDPGNGNEASATTQTLTSMAANLEPIGGGDYPEATKTSLARAHQLMRKDATTIVLFYTDAPPHCWMVADRDRGSNYHAEQTALKSPTSFGGNGPRFTDWVSACKFLHEGEKNAHVFCFLDKMLGSRPLDWGYYAYLSTITRGACFTLTSAAPQSIAQVTIDVLLAWMGVRKEAVENTMAADLMRYKNGKNIKNVKNEQDEVANSYFWATEKKPAGKDVFVNPDMFRAKQRQAQILLLDNNLAKVAVTSSVLEKHLLKRRTSIMDFAKRYAQDAAYKTIVVEQLDDIIKTDVTSMSLNPVFGVLWRAVCNDRKNPARDKLITAFSFYADKIADADEKARLKNWLEESYDYASEIRDCLNKVPDHQSFPCVYLDPTIDFAPARVKGEKVEDDNEHESDPPLSAFRRDELLEIGRSCDGRILKRLGKVLTRITYVESASDLPAHIAVTSNAQVPRIPIALASQERGWKFWKILLHVVLPGTMLAARPAAVLAALAIRIGLKPLFGAASAAMMFWRDKWNNLEVPETWDSSCLGLLLDADAEHRKLTELSDPATGKEGLLTDVDRELFNRLLTYHHAGTNLLTTLTAEIGWTPSKTQVPVGPVVVCRGCKFPRSITIMAEQSGGQCGLCVRTSYESGEHKNRALTTNVSPQDTAATKIAWVECSIQTCRAQYVCYNTADLNVRPKCWYCRAQNGRSIEKRSSDSSPTLECVKCLSKVIWPNEWRHMAAETFQCSACLNGIKTVMSVETNAAQLCKENRQDWLLQSRKGTIEAPFKQTLLKTITATGIASFLENVQVLPELEPATTLTLKGKQILYASVHLQKPACCQHVVDADVTNSSAKAVSMAGMASTDLEPSSTLPLSSVHSVAVHLQRVLSRRTGKAYTLWAT
ncbi:hypothetical protein N0V91_007429 [Didymella pomorum]|uniref:VWFA domain-containing protein n=1 Tax=Didymella pomorum TaxID=749634 RepID=A0A9W8ZBL0_9PLEO|nr:hypothetical protein N0V91_007429 [Didymella pomorum]